MLSEIKIFAPAIAITFALSGVLSYFGGHIIRRGIIFSDIALAQFSAVGISLGTLLHIGIHSPKIYVLSLIFTLAGAFLLAMGRKIERIANVEAMVGAMYVLGFALSVVLLSRTQQGTEVIRHILSGNILFTTRSDLIKTLLIFSVLGGLIFALREKFDALTDKKLLDIKLEVMFFVLFAVAVSTAVQTAGVFLVFSYLVIPPLVSRILGKGFIFSWSFGVVSTLLAFTISLKVDVPTSPFISLLMSSVAVSLAVSRSFKA